MNKATKFHILEYDVILQRLAEKQAQAIQSRTGMATQYDLEMELQAAYRKRVKSYTLFAYLLLIRTALLSHHTF